MNLNIQICKFGLYMFYQVVLFFRNGSMHATKSERNCKLLDGSHALDYFVLYAKCTVYEIFPA
jgi:hypothetical protein